MKKQETFNERLLIEVAAADARVSQNYGAMLRYEGRNGYVGNMTIYRKQQKLQAMEAVKYEERDLRGLSQKEKELIRDNNYNNFVDVRGTRYYMFIARDLTTGKRRVYGYSKYQIIDPNGDYFHFTETRYNYNAWLILNTDPEAQPFSPYRYEVRAWQTLTPVAI